MVQQLYPACYDARLFRSCHIPEEGSGSDRSLSNRVVAQNFEAMKMGAARISCNPARAGHAAMDIRWPRISTGFFFYWATSSDIPLKIEDALYMSKNSTAGERHCDTIECFSKRLE